MALRQTFQELDRAYQVSDSATVGRLLPGMKVRKPVNNGLGLDILSCSGRPSLLSRALPGTSATARLAWGMLATCESSHLWSYAEIRSLDSLGPARILLIMDSRHNITEPIYSPHSLSCTARPSET